MRQNIEENRPLASTEENQLLESLLGKRYAKFLQTFLSCVDGLEVPGADEGAYTYESRRSRIKYELSLWVKTLESGSSDPKEFVSIYEEEYRRAKKNLAENLCLIHNEVHKLEATYRGLDAFFVNAGQGKVDCITLMNVNKDELGDHDSEGTKAVRDELDRYNNGLTLRHRYSILVIPGYLGDVKTLRMWARTAYMNRIIMLTDFKDCTTFEALMEELRIAHLQASDPYLGHVVMTVNYILGRERSEQVGVDECLYIPASSALAGCLANMQKATIVQAAEGVTHGILDGFGTTRINLRYSEIDTLRDRGVIPIADEDGRVIAWDCHTLYDGSHKGLMEYSTVRVSNWIGSGLEHFCNEHAMGILTPGIRGEIMRDMHDFLRDCVESYGIIDKYMELQIEQAPQDKTWTIRVNITLNTHFTTQDFGLTLIGRLSPCYELSWERNIT